MKDVTVVMTPRSLSAVHDDTRKLILCRLSFVFTLVDICNFSFLLCESRNYLEFTKSDSKFVHFKSFPHLYKAPCQAIEEIQSNR